MKKPAKRIRNKVSKTASFTCLSRAVSFFEKKSQYKSNDYIAIKLIPKLFLFLIKAGWFRKFYKNILAWKGLYEYVIARTKYIDSVFQKAISNGFIQILIFGAGFDSRGIRFGRANNNVKIFEMDAPITQNAKIDQFKKRKIDIQSNIIFFPVDFDNESAENKLMEYGFKKNKKTLFILEGLLMYLHPESVDNIFELINKFAGKGSEIVFDYIYSSVIRGENLYYGESGILKKIKNTNEPWLFGMEKGEIKLFLKKWNLKLVENLNSEDLEKRFFTDERGNTVVKINGTHCIVRAKK